MNDFLKNLIAVIEAEPFLGSQRALAIKAGIDRAQLYRVINSELDPTPRLVGRIAAVLPHHERAMLINSYLQAVAALVTEQQLAAKDYKPPVKRRSVKVKARSQ